LSEIITQPSAGTEPLGAGQALDADPAAPSVETPGLSVAEHHLLFIEWCDTAGDFPLVPLIHELVAEQARLAPEAIAVADGGRWITYGELDARANGLARRLRDTGVGPETRVAVLAERSIELVLGSLAILKAGGAYVPIDPRFPRERQEFMLEDSRAAVVLVHPNLAPQLAATAVPVLRLEIDEIPRATPPSTSAGPENVAYVIYTSGSTGRPKGAEIEHASLIRLIRWHLETYRFAAGDRATLFSGPSFDVSVWEVWSCLAAGASLHIPDEECRASAPRMIRWLAEHAITHGVVSTPLAELMIGEPWPAEMALRTLTTGGDRLRQWPGADFPCPLFNIYGPTENTVVTTCFVLRPGAGREGVLPPIGRPLANVRVYLLDPDFRPVRPGDAGELWIGGGGLGRGYLERPELTAEKFVPDPFAGEREEPGARLYRTGDLARYLPDGNLEFLGRIDFQIKIRGFRIEPGEIEAELVAHPGVREVIVLPRDGEPGGTRLVAYLVAGTPAPTTGEIRDYLGVILPEYMVPSAFVWLDALPLTPNGKIDRRSLAAIPVEFASSVSYEAPRTETEKVLAGIWEEVLAVERVGIRDPFFHLGGHSLLAVQVLSRIRRLFGVGLPVRALFDFPTVESLALAIERELPEKETALAPSPGSRDRELPLSFAQQRLWFLDRLRPGTSVYNVPMAYRLRGNLRPAALVAALGEIVRRHEALRTRFAERENGPVQIVEPAASLSLPQVDLASLSEPAGRREQDRLLAVEALRPFDLERGPLLRPLLLRPAAGEWVLILSMHHIVSDGWSMGVLLRELGTLYGAALAGDPSPLPELPMQYADYAIWQRDWLRGEVLENQLGYWRERLAGHPPLLELPTDRPRPAVQTSRGGVVPLAMEPRLGDALRALSQQSGTPLFMTMLAGFLALLHRYTGGTDLLVGTPTAGRNRVELEALIGFFVNTLVLRTDLSGDPSFTKLLERVRETAVAAYTHSDLPFEQLVEELAPERSLDHSPLFQVVFVLQAEQGGPPRLPELESHELTLSTGTAKFDLTLGLAETAGGGIAGELEYNRDLFDVATSRRILDHLRILLAGVAADPSARLSELPLLSPAERRSLLVEWNATRADFPGERSIHGLFAQRARQTPEALAVTAAGGRITYGELDARANRLAARLRAAGVGPETLVALCAERSIEWVVAMLAILKAGGAYVPLDPSYPGERLAFLLADTGAPVLLAQERLAAMLPTAAARVILLDRPDDAAAPAVAPASGRDEIGGDHLAYVIYTSGSTGRPKGVAVPHRAVLRLVLGTDFLQLVPGDRVAQAANASFDAATFELWGPLLNGGSLAILPQEVVLSPAALAADLRDRGIRKMFLTTALFNQMAREAPGAFAPLDEVLFGGEAVDPAAVRAVLRDGAPRRLLHVYGPTENATFSTWFAVEGLAETATTVPIGKPIANTRAYVLDLHLRPVPVGVHGSLYLGGDGLARGYLNRPELTAERFVPAPFGMEAGLEPGERLYATGDLARLLADGNIEFLGRADQQVKIRGFRIEPGEIEAVLAGYPGVLEAVVLALADGAGGRRLVAYAAIAGEAPVVGEVRGYLRSKLPDYMVPGVFVWLEALPLTPNGKVDRRALPAPERPVETMAGPRTPLEQSLADIFCQVFGLPAVGVHDDFFALGGHSLLATQVVSRVRRRLGIDLEIRALFEESTIERLARHIEAEGYREPGADATDAAVPLGGTARTSNHESSFVPPRTPLEELMAGIWSEVLNLDRVGLHDDFWDLGGRSPLADEVLARVNESFGIELPPQTLYSSPTIASFTAAIGEILLAEEPDDLEPIGMGEV
jgi:amino acid adenylation domain-containing protein